ncbi:unnamed protein product [Penicillium salamii]|uniref:Uncharacterized protein n=1 Tax=Penicillium salamii TaxID=1612424 RepID=A0A9W4JEC7_9EURO|nr:unnamed protein product [Penicillium salamii]CAG8889452.1 unnamed protein product [Penicillium salamii]
MPSSIALLGSTTRKQIWQYSEVIPRDGMAQVKASCAPELGVRRQRHNGPNGCVLLRFSPLPMNDNTARGSLSTRSPLFSTHCKKFFSNEPDFSLIEQFVTWNHQNQENTLSNLKRCDAARLENFYRSAFEGLDLQACEAILHLWRGSLSREVLFGIQNTCSKELTRPDALYHILRVSHE